MAKSRGLTAKQAAFVREYLRNGGHGTNAAIVAGFSKKNADSIASQLLKKPQVSDAIARKAERIEERAEIDQAEIIKLLAAQARLDIKDMFDDDGNPLPISKLPLAVRQSISGLETSEIWGPTDDGEGNEGRIVVGQTKKIKFESRQGALKMLGQHLKLFTEIHEHKHTHTLEQLVEASAAAQVVEGEVVRKGRKVQSQLEAMVGT